MWGLLRLAPSNLVATLAALAGEMVGIGHGGLGYTYVLVDSDNLAVCHINEVVKL